MGMNLFRKLFGRKDDHSDESPEFRAFLEGSMEGLQLQKSAHENTWQLGKEERWDFTQDAGELIWTFSDQLVVAAAQIIGTFDKRAKTWLWAWANPSKFASTASSTTSNVSRCPNGLPKRKTVGKWRPRQSPLQLERRISRPSRNDVSFFHVWRGSD
jgi:hypothetical protein